MSYIRIHNLINQKFGRLIVLKDIGRTKTGRVIWLCRCDCGKEKAINGHELGRTLSCGCLYKEMRGKTHVTHGMRHTPLYEVWAGMKARCYNINHVSYKYYGGRGIQVCISWLKFQNFYDDMVLTYKKGLTLERINNNGNYEPYNCRWITRLEQANNQRSNRIISYKGITKTLAQWARKTKLKSDLIRYRLDILHWSIEKTFNTPYQ